MFKYVKDVKVWGISDAFEFPTIMCFVYEFGLYLLYTLLFISIHLILELIIS